MRWLCWKKKWCLIMMAALGWVALQKSSAWCEAALILQWLKLNHSAVGLCLNPSVTCNMEIKRLSGKFKFLVILVIFYSELLLPIHPLLCTFPAEWGLQSSYGFCSWLSNTKSLAIITIAVHLVCNTSCRKTEINFAVFCVLFRHKRQNDLLFFLYVELKM